LSAPRREAYAALWSELAAESAPLRAVVNGRLVGVPEDFYDFALRANIPDGEFPSALLIGKALSFVNGVGHRWLHLRIRHMIGAGELIEVRPANGDHPYSNVLKRGSR